MRVCVYVCICVYVRIRVYVCMCVCVHVCMCIPIIYLEGRNKYPNPAFGLTWCLQGTRMVPTGPAGLSPCTCNLNFLLSYSFNVFKNNKLIRLSE